MKEVGWLLLLVAMPALGEVVFPWQKWQLEKDMATITNGEIERTVDGWSSARGVGDYVVVARLIPTPQGVNCVVDYSVPDTDAEIEDQFILITPMKGAAQNVTRYAGLPRAMSECRKAIEEKISLPPGPVSTASGPHGVDL